MLYPHIARLVHGQPWAILPEKLDEIVSILAFRSEGGRLSSEEIEARIAPGRAAQPAGAQRQGAVAVIPVYGVISQRAGQMQQVSGGTSTADVAGMLNQAMADPNVGSILLDVCSPGGGVYGVPELADQIRAARAEKPIVALANAQAASAAYWIASAASELVVVPSGQVGAIGVYTTHFDKSRALAEEGITATVIRAGKYKAEDLPFSPLSPEAQAAVQESVDGYYAMFCDSVAAGRGCSAAAVRDGMGQGRMVSARDAVRLGMADRVATYEQTITRMMGLRAPASASQRAAIESDPVRVPLMAPATASANAADAEIYRRRLALRAL